MNDKELLKRVSSYDLLEELRRRLLTTAKTTQNTVPNTKSIQGEIGEILTLQGQTGEYKLVKLINLETILVFGEDGKGLEEGKSYEFEVREGKNDSNILVSYNELI